MRYLPFHFTTNKIKLARASLFTALILLVMGATFASQAQATAGINKTINFQGKVVNRTGSTNVADGNYNFTFKIYDAATSGTLLWTENFNTTNSNQLTVTNGIFQVALGSVCSFSGGSCQGNTNTGVDFNSDSIYLDITFNGETMGTRVRFAAVPYAMNADKVAGLTVTNNGTNTLNIAAGKTLKVDNTLEFAGTDSTVFTLPTITDTIAGLSATQTFTNKTLTSPIIANIAPGADFTLTQNSVAPFTSVNSGAVANTLYLKTGNVGIGTTTPSTNLDVTNSANSATYPLYLANLNVGTSASVGQQFMLSLSGASAERTAASILAVKSGTWSTGTASTVLSDLTFSTRNSDVLAEQMRLTAAGNLGIGTSSPGSYRLNVNGDTNITGNLNLTGSCTGCGSGLSQWTTTGSDIYYSTGNVGIGSTSAPTSLLQVIKNQNAVTTAEVNNVNTGNVAAAIVKATSNITSGYIESFSSTFVLAQYASTAMLASSGTTLLLGTNNAEKVRINTNGNVGIGTTLPGYALHVAGSTGIGIGTAGSVNGLLSFLSSGTSIGAPTIATDVSGNLNIATTQSGATTSVGSGNGNIAFSLTNQADVLLATKTLTLGSSYSSADYTFQRTLTQASTFTSGGKVLYVTDTSGGSNTINPDLLVVNAAPTSGTFTGTLLRLQVGGTDKVLVDSNGNVGIGTTAPTGALDVAGTGKGAIIETDTFTSIGNGASGNDGANAVGNSVGDSGSMLPNSNFESAVSNTIADGWFVSATSSGEFSGETTNIAKGSRSIKATITTATKTQAVIYSTCIPIAGPAAGTYNLEYYIKSTGTLVTVQGALETYTSKANCQANTTPLVVNGQVKVTTAAWLKNGATLGSLGTTATWGRAMFQFICASGCTAVPTYIDGVRLIQSALTNGLDYAENYPGDPEDIPQPGDVVSLQSKGNNVVAVKSHTPMDQSAIGVVSTNPGETLDDGTITNPVPIALSGRVPVDVSTKNGVIHVGDYLTSSDIPGVAVKAILPGSVIGTAMSDDTDSDTTAVHQVTMFVKNTYYAGSGSAISDLSFIGEANKTADEQASLSADMITQSDGVTTLHVDHVIAAKDITAPVVTAEALFTKQIIASSDADLVMSISPNHQLVVTGSTASESAFTVDAAGNGTFAGTINAKRIKADQIDGLDILESQVASLSALFMQTSPNPLLSGEGSSTGTASSSSVTTVAQMTSSSVLLSDLSSDGMATVSADLRVKGSGLFEGMLSVVDTLTTNNFIVNGLSDFFNNVIFHKDVQFVGRPTFNSDTAGFAVVKKGGRAVDVTFDTEYESQPIITATIVSVKLTDNELKQEVDEGVCTKDGTIETCQEAIESNLLTTNSHYIVTRTSPKGFTILLSADADFDLTFSWNAMAIKDARTFTTTSYVIPKPTAAILGTSMNATNSAVSR